MSGLDGECVYFPDEVFLVIVFEVKPGKPLRLELYREWVCGLQCIQQLQRCHRSDAFKTYTAIRGGPLPPAHMQM